MATRTVVKRTRSDQPAVTTGFQFTREMMPTFEGDAASNLEYRNQAWEVYASMPMPTTTDEPWRRTDLRSLKTGLFHMVNGTARQLPQPPEELLQPLVGDQHGGQLVLLPDGPRLSLDPELSQKGVIFTDLLTAEREYPELLAKIRGTIVRPDEGKFAALAGSLAKAGVFIYIPRGLEVTDPLHSILWAPGDELAYFSHLLVYLEEGSSLTYVHEASSPAHGEAQSLHAGIVEIHVGPAASLRFVELQSLGSNVWNFSHERANVGQDANLDWIFGALGSRVTKNFSELDLIGRGATGRMSGFYFTDGEQHLDHDTQQNHLAPNTTSDLLFKGALKDQSRSVWQGMIYVAPGAQKTDGYQANRNLVLSPKARADSIPGLEILADDVRCTHGATVGKIDAEQVFYLLSRGIPYSEAEKLIVEGFFDPIMQRIAFEGVRSRFQQAIQEKMEGR
jgi:Fe-S cluster assembly protein SufD